jgi:hypothetical protein
MSGQLHALAALPPGKENTTPIWTEAEWAREQVCKTWRGENSYPYRDPNSTTPEVVQAVASRYTDCAVSATRMLGE